MLVACPIARRTSCTRTSAVKKMKITVATALVLVVPWVVAPVSALPAGFAITQVVNNLEVPTQL